MTKGINWQTIAVALCNLMAVVSLAVAGWVLRSINEVAVRQSAMEARHTANERAANDHHKDATLHMPTEMKYDKFVSRVEWVNQTAARNTEIGDIKAGIIRVAETQKETNAQLQQIYRLLVSNDGRRE